MQIMKYDVVVVGAGPAGSTAAKFLSERGIRTLLLDKSKFPHDKPCGGGLTAKVLKNFKYIEENDLIDSYSYGGAFYSPSLRYKVELQKTEPIVAMVIRKKFDDGLVKIAIGSGATFLDGKNVVDIKVLKGKTKVIFDNGTEIDSQIVIGADGIWSTVAKKTGLGHHNDIFGVSIFEEYPMKTEILDQYFTEKRLIHGHIKILGLAGYGWVFPKKECVNIGVTEIISAASKLRGKTNLKEVYKKYFQILKECKIIPDNLNINKLRGGALPFRPLDKTYTDRVILCGDAAGLINPVTGEGIDFAMDSGHIAAGVIIEALERDDFSAQFLSKYERIWKTDFGKDLKLLLRASGLWGKGSENIIKLASEDKKMADMFFKIGVGNLSINKYKWKLVKRMIYYKLKNLFKK